HQGDIRRSFSRFLAKNARVYWFARIMSTDRRHSRNSVHVPLQLWDTKALATAFGVVARSSPLTRSITLGVCPPACAPCRWNLATAQVRGVQHPMHTRHPAVTV